MYAVTEVAASGWRSIFEWLAARTGIDLTAADHPPPAPISELWAQAISCTSPRGADTVKVPRSLVAHLTESLCYAA